MKKCPNPECPSYQQNREFYDDDTICPRCGDVLASAGPGSATAVYPAYAVAAPADSPLSHAGALLGAAGTLLLVFLIIGFLLQFGLFHRRPGTPPAALTLPAGTTFLTPVPVGGSVSGSAPTLVAGLPTPIGGFLAGTPGAGITTHALPTLPPLPGPVGGGGGTGPAATPGADPNGGLPATTPDTRATGVNSSLCRRIDAGQLCEAVSTYGARDTIYLAVQATFGDGAARTIRVRLFGPPNGETPLLGQDQTNTPGRDGRYWVGFAFGQNGAWTPGVYRADIFVNNATTRAAYATWTVQP